MKTIDNPGRWPVKIRQGNTIVNIYRTKNKGDRFLYCLSYMESGRRKRSNFSDLARAKAEANRIAVELDRGLLQGIQLTRENRLELERARDLAAKIGKPLDEIASEYLKLTERLGPERTLEEAVSFLLLHGKRQPVDRKIADVVEEFVESLKTLKRSSRYIEDVRSRLRRFAGEFPGTIGTVRRKDIVAWLDGLDAAPRTRNNFHASIVTLFTFARTHGYLPDDVRTEADGIASATERRAEPGILAPGDMAVLLKAAEARLLPYLLLGGFAGLRESEILRLDWSAVRLGTENVITIDARISKTNKRRVVPIQPNLRSWLAPLAKDRGPVCPDSMMREQRQALCTRLGLSWPGNALRHSYGTYRVAATGEVGRVALEMGNSEAVILQRYHKAVSEAEAAKWWAISKKPRGRKTPPPPNPV